MPRAAAVRDKGEPRADGALRCVRVGAINPPGPIYLVGREVGVGERRPQARRWRSAAVPGTG
ncbi:hypothetical protein GCM10010464_81000 [Pseudonocardia yunnanensis]